MDPAIKAKELLKFSFDPVQFARGGETWIKPEVRRAIERGKTKFQEIVDEAGRISEDTGEYAQEYYHRFMLATKNDQNLDNIKRAFSTHRDRLRLVRILMYKPDETSGQILLSQHSQKVLQFLYHNWAYSMIFPFMNILIKHWRKLPRLMHSKIHSILEEKLQQYNGTRPSFTNLRPTLRFFKAQTGPAQFVADLHAKGKTIGAIYEITPFSRSMHGYEYISEYAVQYIRLAEKTHKLDTETLSILKFLEDFGCTFTYQRGVPPLIIHAYRASSPADQETLFREAIRIMGDPADPVKWRPTSDLQPEEKNEFEKARNILNEWLTRQYIDVFFEVIATDMDDRRKRFWQTCLKHITNLKIFGKSAHRMKLKRDPRIRELVDFRFGELVEGGSNECALCFHIDKWLFVEFSLHGNALYVYPTQANYCPHILNNSLRVSQLKHKYYRNINAHFRLEYGYDEGRLFHNDGWEKKLRSWMTNHLRI